ncbi:MAG: hypothetical protein ACJAX3_002827 [Patiriisocius sp.]|jgi:hypothetical protein
MFEVKSQNDLKSRFSFALGITILALYWQLKKQSTKGNFDISKIVFYPNQLVAKVVLGLFSRYFSERFEQE